MWPGRPYPLGAAYDGIGTNFTLFSEVAERVELCLFDAGGGEERLDITELDGYVWHCYLPGTGPGQRYGYRVHGPHDPRAGLRCNPAKLLIDPYATAIDGEVRWDRAVFGYPLGGDDRKRYDGGSCASRGTRACCTRRTSRGSPWTGISSTAVTPSRRRCSITAGCAMPA